MPTSASSMFDFLSVPSFSASFVLSKPILFIILAIAFVIYATISGVLLYHWTRYGMKSHSIMVAKTLFFFVSAFLFITACVGLILF